MTSMDILFDTFVYPMEKLKERTLVAGIFMKLGNRWVPLPITNLIAQNTKKKKKEAKNLELTAFKPKVPS